MPVPVPEVRKSAEELPASPKGFPQKLRTLPHPAAGNFPLIEYVISDHLAATAVHSPEKQLISHRLGARNGFQGRLAAGSADISGSEGPLQASVF